MEYVEQTEDTCSSDTWSNSITGTKYWKFWESLVVQEGITYMYKGEVYLVPQSLRADYLKRMYTSHTGQESTLQRTKDAVYRSKMSQDSTLPMLWGRH